MMLLLLLASAASPIDACAQAVHNDLPAAAIACRVPQPKLEEGADPTDPSSYTTGVSEACAKAIEAGRMAGKSAAGPIPPVARTGLVRDFDAKLAACRAPAKKDYPPEVPTTNLWD
ncbi:hypothetical protein [Novosphingobium huizhouense]|uniref:hypothetical protein n=1 Tax=Novosphingobium huizhouense TaxID=2866625 RepID=UPI001CD8A47B|nr:hypothetical protein [Novosphingobium huizhouense]